MRAGDVVWNTLTGEKALFVETAEETEGRRIVVDFAVERGGFVPGGEHLHPTCSEHLEVRSGRIAFDLGGEERELGAGEEITVVPGAWHRWWNAGQDEVRIRARVEPAIRFQEAILVFWGMCSDGLTNDEGQPAPLPGALVATRYGREIRYRRPPVAVQRVAFPPLAAVARRRGLDDTLDRYLDLATHPSAEAGLGRLPDRVMERGYPPEPRPPGRRPCRDPSKSAAIAVTFAARRVVSANGARVSSRDFLAPDRRNRTARTSALSPPTPTRARPSPTHRRVTFSGSYST